MQSAYVSGDPYLTFAKQAGAVPEDATKKSHAAEREQFKVCALAVQYGMGARSLAESLGEPEHTGRRLLQLHKQTYPQFWRWSQSATDHGVLSCQLQTVFGWTLNIGDDPNPRSLANFPCQANGAEMLRLACCLMVERGVQVLAPVHDAVLIEAPLDQIESSVRAAQAAMQEAGEIILGGMKLRTDADIICYPDRYVDRRGAEMWKSVNEILDSLTTGHRCPGTPDN